MMQKGTFKCILIILHYYFMQKGDRKSWTKPHAVSWPDPHDFSTWEDKLLMISATKSALGTVS